MKDFALKHPVAASSIIFLTIFIGGTVVVMICGTLMVGKCKPQDPGDPCDSGAMFIVALWSLVVPASLILGIVGAIATYIILLRKIKTKKEQS